MQRSILAGLFALAFVFILSTPITTHAVFSTSLGHVNSDAPMGAILGVSSLAESQIQAILGLLTTFGVESEVVTSVSRALRGTQVPQPKASTPQSTTTATAPVLGATSTADSRSYRMALFDSPTGADADMPMFREGDPQPPGQSIMHVLNWNSTLFGFTLAGYGYDFSRVGAFLIDEPFWPGDSEVNPCLDPAGIRFEWLKEASANLSAAATTLKNRNASARIWVNYSVPEIKWMQQGTCKPHFAMNGSFIDVVSIDFYFVDFTTQVRPLYEWLLANRGKADQQIALIPGTGVREGVDDATHIAGLISGFFSYAREKNSLCTDLNKCLVWLVSGWPALNYPPNPPSSPDSWIGELDPRMSAIQTVWRAELAKPIQVPPPNNPPSTPTITGPKIGTVGQKLSFTLNATDPDGDTIRYGNNGGSGTSILYWSNFVPSGTSVTLPDWVWNTAGTKTIWVQTEDSKGSRSTLASYTVTITSPNTPPTAPTISGPTTGTTGQKLSFTLTATDPNGDQVRYGNNGGSGTPILYWSGFVPSGTSTALPDWVWNTAGTKTVWVQAEDSKGARSALASYAVTITTPNNPPTTATISGPTTGTVGQKLSFTLNATDPDGDTIRYSNNGGDNTQSATYWSGYVSSGTSVALPDWIWYSAGVKTLWVQVQDNKGAGSGWASHSVTIQ